MDTHRLTARALAEKADEPGEAPKYLSYAYPLRADVLVGSPDKGEIAYRQYHGHTDAEYYLFPVVDREQTLAEELFGGVPLSPYYRSVREYAAEELRLTEQFRVPEGCVDDFCEALAETLEQALTHLDAQGVVAGADGVCANMRIELWLSQAAIERVNSEEDRLEWRDCIRITADAVKFSFNTPKILA